MDSRAVRWFTHLSIIAFGLFSCACGAPTDAGAVDSTSEPLIGTVYGSVPAGMPSRLLVGLVETGGETWMKTSGVRWDARYEYFTKGWVNNWGWGSYDGSWGLAYMQECASQGYMPAIAYYQINGEAGGGESAFYAKVQNATTMRGYFGDYKILMQRAKDFGRPVLIMLEADGFGYLQSQTGANPNAYAAVAASGVPELAGLPNTVAGWGLAFLQLRKSVGATNVILGVHISAWATGKDISYVSVTAPLQPEVDSAYNFLKPLGLAANVTGQTFDVLVGDPLDRDSDYYRLVRNQDMWWDASDTASISSKSFNRYAEWMRLWNVTSGKRWVLWQIPVGNSNHLNVPYNGGPREGYKDNRAEYFFGAGSTAHLEKFASSGAIALLFGRGEGAQSTFTNDVYTDGQLFMKSRAGAFLNAGGLAIPSGTSSGSTGGADAGTASDAGSPPAVDAGTSTTADAGTSTADAGTSGTPDAGTPTTSAPVIAATATVSASSATSGAAVTITAKATNSGGALSGGVIDIEVYDAAGAKQAQQFFTISIAAGASATQSISWTAPATAGTYTVMVGVFGAGWTPMYVWNNAAATIAVSAALPPPPPPPPPPATTSGFDFESGAQGWTGTGGIINSVASSTARAYAGTHSLAVNVRGTSNGAGSALVSGVSVPAGKTVTFHVWVPSRNNLTYVRPFVRLADGSRVAVSRSIYVLSLQAWNTITVAVPATASADQIGLDLGTGGNWKGAVYVDAVTW